MYKFLDGLEPEQFMFIGIVEDYDAELSYLSKLFKWKEVKKYSGPVPMPANVAAGNRGLSGNTDYTSAGSASGTQHTRWALRNIHR